jgi:hypothetical protein
MKTDFTKHISQPAARPVAPRNLFGAGEKVLLDLLVERGAMTKAECCIALAIAVDDLTDGTDAWVLLETILEEGARLELVDGRVRSAYYPIPSSQDRQERSAVWERFCDNSHSVFEEGPAGLYSLFTDRQGEHFVAEVLSRGHDWFDVRVTQRSRDQGIDILGNLAVLRERMVPAVAQVKWYRPGGSSVGIEEVQAASGAAGEGVCCVITTSNFTPAATAWQMTKQRLLLVDGPALLAATRRAMGSEIV